MAAHANLKNEFTEDEKYHDLMTWLISTLTMRCYGSVCLSWNYNMSHFMRKPVYAICEQQRCRSACAYAQSDQHLCCSLPRWYNNSSFYIRNLKPLPSFCGCTGRSESTLVANPKDRFSRDVAHITALEQTLYLVVSWIFSSLQPHYLA